MDKKMFGIFEHRVLQRKVPFVRGFDDIFYAPHSRYTTVSKEDIQRCGDLVVLAESEEAGVFIAIAKDGKQIFVMGHPEYDRISLDKEYKRDIAKGLDIALPQNYYPEDMPEQRPNLVWRAHANAMYTNWLNYYVYQVTPYIL
jgi:homoserine O-succinyltransferase